MTDASMDEFGPVDYLVIEFPAGQATFNGEMATELAALTEAGIIRILDLVGVVTITGDHVVPDATEHRVAAVVAVTPSPTRI